MPVLLGCISTLFHCLMVYSTFLAVLETLEELDLYQTAESGRSLSRIYLSLGISGIILTAMTSIPALERIYMVLATAAGITDFLSTVLYLLFLMHSHGTIVEKKMEQ